MIKSILAVSEGGADGIMAYRLAALVARRLGAAVDTVFAPARSSDEVNIGAQAMPFLRDLDRSRIEAQARDTAKAYAEFVAATPGATFTRDSSGDLDVLVGMGRRAGLIVVGRPGLDHDNPEPASISAMIHDSARPVMVAPPNLADRRFASVVVAWNASRPASRAAGYALPFLQAADKVTVITVDAAPDDATDALLLKHLARHGIAASMERLQPAVASGRARGRALVERVRTGDVDLLVMGAYGGGQLRTFLGLGGATGKVLSSCPVPLLMAH